MFIDPENSVVKLCTTGMEQEMAGRPALAKQLYLEAWGKSTTDTERFTAAHYVARVQENIAAKLKWDQLALDLALKIDTEDIKGVFPSLYLNIAKGYEDLDQKQAARDHYVKAQAFTAFLLDDGYGKMIRSGIEAGLVRLGQ